MLGDLKLLAFIEALLVTGMLLFRFCQRPDSRKIIKPVYVWAVLLTPAAGLTLHNYNLFYLFLIVLPFAARGDRRKLAGIYLAVLLQFPELTQAYVVGSVYLGTVSAITVFNLGAVLALLGTRDRERRGLGAMDAVAWTFFFLILMSLARGYEGSTALRLTQYTFLNFMPAYLVLSRCIRSRQDANDAMLVFAWSALMCAVVAGFESIRGWPLYQALQYSLHVPAVGQGLSATLSIRSGFLRAQGPVANPTSLGVVMAMGLHFALGLRRNFVMPQGWAVYGVLIVGLIVSQSRGAWIAAGVGYLIRLLLQRRYGLLAIIAPIGLLAWAISGSVSGEGQLGQLLGKSGQGEFTAQYRSRLLDRGLEEIGKHPLGQTPEGLQITMDDMRQGEHIIDFVNSHLYIALVTGVAGGLLWLGLWIYPIAASISTKSKLRRQMQMPLELPAAGLAACFVALLFTSPIDRNPSMVALVLGFIAAMIRIARREMAASRRRETTDDVKIAKKALAVS